MESKPRQYEANQLTHDISTMSETCKYIIDDPAPSHHDKDLLYHLYWGLGWSTIEIARYTTAQGAGAVIRMLHIYGIPTRGVADSQGTQHFRRYQRDDEQWTVDTEGYLTIEEESESMNEYTTYQRATGD